MAEILLTGQKCVLLHITPAIVDAIIERHSEFLKDPEVTHYLDVSDTSVSYQRRKFMDIAGSSTQCAMAVLKGTDDWNLKSIGSRYIGMTTLRGIDRYNLIAHSGSMIGDKSLWGRGFGKEAKLLQLYYAFMVVELRWVYSRTVRPNIASARMLEGTGYVSQGARSNCRRIGADFHDELLFCVDKERWRLVWNERALVRIE